MPLVEIQRRRQTLAPQYANAPRTSMAATASVFTSHDGRQQRKHHSRVESSVEDMMTSLVDIDAAKGRLEAGEQPYAFEISDNIMMVGPACKFGADYLRHLRTEGRYAESFDEATRMADARGATITGVWFVKPPPPTS